MRADATPDEAALADLRAAFDRLRDADRRDPSPPGWRQRRGELTRLRSAIEARVPDVVRATGADYGHRSPHETLLADVHLSLSGLDYARRRVRRWMRPRRRRVALPFLPARAHVVHQPRGVVGIVSPWNYPVQLAILPLVAAIAAGNRVLLKPSEVTPRTSAVLRAIVEAALPPEKAAVITGGPEVGEAFTRLPFDHLFFTGSTRVGRRVARAASENLVPVTLELGGKSPALLDETFPLEVFAERVAAGKLFNAGQTCVAPDWALVPASRLDAAIDALRAAFQRLYPTIRDNPDYSAIVSESHRRRLENLLIDAEGKGAIVLPVHPADERLVPGTPKLYPTIVRAVGDDMALLEEEIFGPILPVRGYREVEEAIRLVNAQPSPLALYVFSDSRRLVREVIDRTRSGAVCVNDTVVHAAQDDLPFGGVGESGMGRYHGREGFEAFSNARAVLRRGRLSLASALRPPYGRSADRVLRILVGKEGVACAREASSHDGGEAST